MTPEAMARLEQIGPECVAVACDALLARLRRIHRAVDDAPSEAEALRREAARAHVAHAEALLNLLTVLREMGGAERARPIQAGLDALLARVGRGFPAPDDFSCPRP